MTAAEKLPLIVFDTTLRDGEQSPGCTLTLKEKIQIAKQLSRLGVTVCEAGFPLASEGDFLAVQTIAREVGPLTDNRKNGPMVICGLARCKKIDIERCYEAIKDAPRHRIHTFLATSDIHLEYKLKITREQCTQQVKEMVTLARSLVEDVEFSCEDAGRTDREFLAEVCGVAIEAGATTLNIPDTVGYNMPEEYGELIKYLVDNTPGYDPEKIFFSTHCHNDLGLAVANTLAGIKNGARQVEVTINGIGERAGNTAMEEVIMTMATHPHSYPCSIEIDTPQIMRTSKMVSSYSGMMVQGNKAIVGANAFAHESGIHQDGMLKNASTYEIMKPESVGVRGQLTMGKLSGRAAFRSRLTEMGYEVDDEALNKSFVRFKEVADSGKTITDDVIEALVQDELERIPVYDLQYVQVTCGQDITATATVTIKTPTNEKITTASVGDGPVNAIFKAIDLVCKEPVALKEYHVKSITSGDDAVGEVHVIIGKKKEENSENSETEKRTAEEQELSEESLYALTQTYNGRGTSHDILIASARAYISAINKFITTKKENPRKKRRMSCDSSIGNV